MTIEEQNRELEQGDDEDVAAASKEIKELERELNRLRSICPPGTLVEALKQDPDTDYVLELLRDRTIDEEGYIRAKSGIEDYAMIPAGDLCIVVSFLLYVPPPIIAVDANVDNKYPAYTRSVIRMKLVHQATGVAGDVYLSSRVHAMNNGYKHSRGFKHRVKIVEV